MQGWDFSYLKGRRHSDPPPWDYINKVCSMLDGTHHMLDMETGGGEVLGDLKEHARYWPDRVFATEGYKPNVDVATRRLQPVGIEVVECESNENLPFEIAVDLGYDSQTAFTRAFKRIFGTTPGKYRRNRRYTIVCERIDVARAVSELQGEIKMTPKIIDMGEIVVMGPVLHTKNDGSNTTQIPQFWNRFMEEKTFERIPSKTHPERSYGMCSEYGEDGSFSYLIGYDVAPGTETPEGLLTWKIPPRKYVVFTSKGDFPKSIQEMWKAIYADWFPTNGKWERAAGEEFEVYEAARMYEGGGECDIYIPVKSKEA